jgi:hypothetical protein
MYEGRYSYDPVKLTLTGVGTRDLLGKVLCVLAAALERMAARWGILERAAIPTSLEVALEDMSEFGNIPVSGDPDRAGSSGLRP